MKHPPSFPYRALRKSRNEIRVLELQPSNDPDAPLRGTLRRVPLDEAVYTAISYVWGSSQGRGSEIKIKQSTTICGRHFKLPTQPNLTAVLMCMRQKSEVVSLWIDAICINQRNTREKSWQLDLMRDIYSKARNVRAWLGPLADILPPNVVENRRLAVQQIDAGGLEFAEEIWILACQTGLIENNATEADWLDACFATAEGTSGSQQTHQAASAAAERLRGAVIAQKSWHQALIGLKAIANLPYFSRVWILQETGRAQHLIFHWKDREISDRRLFLALCLAYSLRGYEPLSAALKDFDSRFLTCLTARTTCVKGSSLEDVFKAAFYKTPPLHEATNAEDLIYGRLGLAIDSKGFKDKAETMDAPRTFHEMSCILLRDQFTDPLVSFKPYKGARGRFWEKLPSWAYDWTEKGLDTFLAYNAAANSHPSVSIVDYPQAKLKTALKLTGAPIGSMYAIGRKFSAIAADAGFGDAAIFRADIGYQSIRMSSDRKEMLSNSIEFAYQELGIDAPKHDIELLFKDPSVPLGQFWCWWINWIKEIWMAVESPGSDRPEAAPFSRITELLLRRFPESFRQAVTGNASDTRAGLIALTDVQRWLSALSGPQAENASLDVRLFNPLFQAAWGMRPVLLDTDLLAYVPEDTAPGDRVVIFHGVKAPLVIRPSEPGAYAIIGPAYVCGVMDGELMKTDIHVESFLLG